MLDKVRFSSHEGPKSRGEGRKKRSEAITAQDRNEALKAQKSKPRQRGFALVDASLGRLPVSASERERGTEERSLKGLKVWSGWIRIGSKRRLGGQWRPP